VIDADDNVFIIGTHEAGGTDRDGHIQKFDSNGNENTSNWNLSFTSAGSELDSTTGANFDADGNLYIAGTGANLVTGTSIRDLWIKKFHPDGTENTSNWNLSFSSVGSDELNFTTLHFDGYGQGESEAVPEFTTITLLVALCTVLLGSYFIRREKN